MSGFGAPDLTATPIGDFDQLDAAVGDDLALLGEIVERIADHDQDVGGLAALEPDGNRVRGGAHRRTRGGQHLVAGLSVRIRGPAPL